MQIQKEHEIEVIIGPMFSGKTLLMIEKIEKLRRKGYSCLYIKSSKDTRSPKDKIQTHNFVEKECITVLSLKEAQKMDQVKESQCLGIDEGQMFDDLVKMCKRWIKTKVRILVSGCDSDFKQRPFGQILHLVSRAERVKKLSTLCMICSKRGSFNFRKTEDNSVELIGGADIYRVLCRNCYQNEMLQRKKAKKIAQ